MAFRARFAKRQAGTDALPARRDPARPGGAGTGIPGCDAAPAIAALPVNEADDGRMVHIDGVLVAMMDEVSRI